MSEEEKSELTKIPGIGSATAEKYEAAGFNTIASIAHSSSQQLSDGLTITLAKAQQLINKAQNVMKQEQIIIETGEDVKKFRDTVVKRISTGSKQLDRALGGGVQTDALSLFAGEFGTGKTQIANQLMVNCVLDLKRKTIFLETEPSTFSPDRLLEMSIKGRNQPISLAEDIYAIRSDYLTSCNKIYNAYRMIENDLIMERGIDIGLIVVDSFTGPFRTEFLGRETLTDRGKEMARHIGYLQELSSKYNLAVVITGQVGGIPEPYGQGKAKRRTGIEHNIYGGDMFLHACTVQVSLAQTKGGKETEDEWEAYIFDAPDRPRQTAQFKLLPEGVRDL